MGGKWGGGSSINILVIVPETDPIQGHLACDTTRGGAKWPHGIRHTRAIKMPTLYSLGVGRCLLASWHTLASSRVETKGEGWPKWATEDGGKWRMLRMKLWRALKCWPPSLVKLGEGLPDGRRRFVPWLVWGGFPLTRSSSITGEPPNCQFKPQATV